MSKLVTPLLGELGHAVLRCCFVGNQLSSLLQCLAFTICSAAMAETRSERTLLLCLLFQGRNREGAKMLLQQSFWQKSRSQVQNFTRFSSLVLFGLILHPFFASAAQTLPSQFPFRFIRCIARYAPSSVPSQLSMQDLASFPARHTQETSYKVLMLLSHGILTPHPGIRYIKQRPSSVRQNI